MASRTPVLPIEILVKIFDNNFSLNDLIAAGTVCRDWKISSEDNHLWYPHYAKLASQDPTKDQKTSPRNVLYKQKFVEHVKNLLGGGEINITLEPGVLLANLLGQRLRGIVIFKLTTEIKSNGVFLRLYCEEDSPMVVKVYDYYRIHGKKEYDEKVESKPFNKIFNLKVNPDQSPIKLARGLYRFKFDVPFPHRGEKGEYLSGSLHSEKGLKGLANYQTGSIVYGVEAYVEDDHGSKILHKTIDMHVLPKYDIRDELHKSEPVTATKDTYTLGVSHEYKLSATCPKSVYLPGQKITLDLSVTNAKSSSIKHIKISIRSVIFCPRTSIISTTHLPDKAHTKKEVSWLIDFHVPAKDSRLEKIQVRIPKDIDESILYSKVIQKRHFLFVKLSSTAVLKLPIVIVGNVMTSKQRSE